jgi:chromosome segregation ATPase
MSVATLDRPAALEESAVTDALAALRTNGDALAELFDDVFDDFDRLGNEVDLRSHMLDETKRQASEQAAELQAVRHAEALAKAELTTVRREIALVNEQLTNLPRQNSELREHSHALELERCSLEAELEALRVRTAELADHLAEVKRESAEERVEWSSELKQLRRTLERQAELLTDRLSAIQMIDRTVVPAPVPATSSRTTTESVSAATPAETPKDSVLGSVIAQFEMLQRDRQRRRGQ